MKVEKHPSGASILFDEKWHSYKNLSSPRDRFTSGTKFLKQFFGEFDSEGISARYAKKHGMVQQEVLDMWSRKGEVSREVGTLMHNYLEEKFLRETPPSHEIACVHPDAEITAKALLRLPQADIAYGELEKKYEIISVEKIVADLEGLRSGMVDLVLKDKETRLICLGDYKSNAAIKFDNKWQSGLKCLKHLDDCNYIQYCLQMELYKQIGLKEGYFKEPMGDNIIVHILDDEHSFIPCSDMSSEIAAMIDIADKN